MLHPKEFCIAMSIIEGDTELEDEDQLLLVYICGGLVAIDEVRQTVWLSGYRNW